MEEKIPYLKKLSNATHFTKSKSGSNPNVCPLCHKKIEGSQYDIKCKNGHRVHEKCVNDSSKIIMCPICKVEIPKERNSKLSLISEKDIDDSDNDANA